MYPRLRRWEPAPPDFHEVVMRVETREPGSKTEPGSVPKNEVGARPREPGSRVSSAAHRALDCLLLLRREGDRGAAALELLHVDARVVAPLDRGHDDA